MDRRRSVTVRTTRKEPTEKNALVLINRSQRRTELSHLLVVDVDVVGRGFRANYGCFCDYMQLGSWSWKQSASDSL